MFFQTGANMQNEKVKIGDLNFELVYQSPDDGLPTLEIENDASMIFLKVEQDQARKLRDLLTKFIELKIPEN